MEAKQVDAQVYLRDFKTFLRSKRVCRECAPLLIQMALKLAGAGHSKEVLELVEPLAADAPFTTLVRGLRIHLGLAEAEGADDDEALDLARQLAGA